MRKPNLFIVGAPKSGTTALTTYLGQHPGVFAPSKKEPHFFGSDLHKKVLYPKTEDEYLSYYQESGDAVYALDSSVTYLASQKAAQEIKAFEPKAKIIIMLRHPVDMLYSWHSQLLFGLFENIEDFGTALAAESQRKSGKNIPETAYLVENLFYRDMARYPDQVRRYLDEFGREQVKIILFDDFCRDIGQVWSETLEFLGLKALDSVDLKPVNSNTRWRSQLLQRYLRAFPNNDLLRDIILPPPLRWRVERFNTVRAKRQPMNAQLRAELQGEYEPQIRALQKLIDRDLTAWLN